MIAIGAAVAQAFGRFSYGVLLPAIRDDLEVSNAFAGSLGAVNVGAYLLGTIAVAWGTSHYRLLQVLRVGLTLSATGLLLAANATGPWLLGIALLFMGLGGAMVWIPAPAIAADALAPERRSLAVGVLSSGIGLGVVFTGLLSGFVRSNYGDDAWQQVYLIQGIIATALLGAIALLIRHKQAQPTGNGGFGGFSALKRMRGWIPLTFAYTAFGLLYWLVFGFLTTRLEDDNGWLAADAAWAFTLMGVAMVFGAPLFIAFANKVGVRIALTIAFASWTLLVIAVLPGSFTLTIAAVVGLGFLFSAIPSMITLYVEENTSTADYGPSFAAATLAFGVAQTVSPQIGGSLADATGSFTAVFILSSVLGLIAAAATLRLPARQSSR